MTFFDYADQETDSSDISELNINDDSLMRKAKSLIVVAGTTMLEKFSNYFLLSDLCEMCGRLNKVKTVPGLDYAKLRQRIA